MIFTCTHCGAAYNADARRSGRTRFCSRSCRSTFTARATAARRGDKQRGRGKGKSYRKLNGRHEHRVVAEQMLGRPLQRGEIVHHIDGNRLNNSPENLEVMTQAEHMRRHGIGVPGKPLAHKPWEERWK